LCGQQTNSAGRKISSKGATPIHLFQNDTTPLLAAFCATLSWPAGVRTTSLYGRIFFT
jgi:hypothetical protein